MDAQAEKLKWLNRTELEMLSDKSLSLHEREKNSESLRMVNLTWSKVCIKNHCDTVLIVIDFVVKEMESCNCFQYTQIWSHFANAVLIILFFICYGQKHIFSKHTFGFTWNFLA